MTTKSKDITSSKTAQLFEDFLQKNNLVFYKRVNKSSTIFLLPYSLTDKKLKVTIRVTIFHFHNLCRMSFSRKLNSKYDYSRELLEMNSELLNGSLSVAQNSNSVSFSANFIFYNANDLESIFKENLFTCFSVLINLYNKNNINKDFEDFDEE